MDSYPESASKSLRLRAVLSGEQSHCSLGKRETMSQQPSLRPDLEMWKGGHSFAPIPRSFLAGVVGKYSLP